MRVIIIFGTTEGHTRELCQFVARALRADSHTVAVEEATARAGKANLAAYDVVLVAGSLHVGRFQASLTEFVASHRDVLSAMPSAFISVSLSAAGEDPDDWEGLAQCVAKFEHETGWTPQAVHNAAGAIKFSQYDFFKRLAIKHIAARRGHKTSTSRDYDLTDYQALVDFVREFVERAHLTHSGPAPGSTNGPTTS